jgi:glycosyltransferase involved in cell wall biosynthesis
VPLVSVIMTNFNKEKFITEAVESVLRQTLSDIELIIVDDSSTDRSLQILSDLAKTDFRIKVLSNSVNKGPSYCRNRALKIASGRYISFIDSDDLIRADRLQKMVNAIDARPHRIAYTHVCLIDENGVITSRIHPESRNFPPEGDAGRYVLKEWIWAPSTFMMPSSALKEVGYFDESFRSGEDLDYLIRLTEKYFLAVVPEPLYCYRRHRNSITSALNRVSKGEATAKILERVLKQNWNNLDDATRYMVILRILRSVRIIHMRTKVRWLLNPFFIRTTFRSQSVFDILMHRIIEEFVGIDRKISNVEF